MAHKLLIPVHLVGFAAYLGAGFAQQQLVARSAAGGLEAAVRDNYEKLAAAIVTKIEVPAIGLQLVTGVTFLVINPAWLQLGWMHAKLTCVAALLGLSHAEMFNARKSSRRAPPGATARSRRLPRARRATPSSAPSAACSPSP